MKFDIEEIKRICQEGAPGKSCERCQATGDECKACIAITLSENNTASPLVNEKVLGQLRELVIGEDICSPTIPEYIEHHESIQKILNFIDEQLI